MNEKRLLNNMTPGSKRAGLGDRLIALEEQVAGSILTEAAGDLATLTDTVDTLSDTVATLSSTVAGLPTQATAIADSEEVTNPTVAEFNALLAALRASGAIASE